MLIASALGVILLTAVIGEFAGIVNLTKIVMYSLMLILAVLMFGLWNYVFYEFCYIAFRKWPRIEDPGMKL